jgi:hypothetical protein
VCVAEALWVDQLLDFGVSDRGAPKAAAPWQRPPFERGVRFASEGASFTAHFHEFSLIRLFLSFS